MEIPFTLYLDSDGFIRRECPACVGRFKWHSGRTDSTPDDWTEPPVYWCPLCGKSAPHGSWWTPAQIEYGIQAAAGQIQELAVEEMREATRGIRGGLFAFKVTTGETAPAPDPIVEPDDMVIIEPPCHPWEPLKVPEDGRSRFYCLVCGEVFAA